eukprot:scaffold2261_cov130-Isochrysis_galbana.AAC.5
MSPEWRAPYRGGWVKGSWGRAGAAGEDQRAHLAAMGDAGAAPPSGGVRPARARPFTALFPSPFSQISACRCRKEHKPIMDSERAPHLRCFAHWGRTPIH